MRRRSSILTCFGAFSLFSLCLLALLTIVVTLSIPQRAYQVFGPPSPGLGYLHRLYYATFLIIRETSLTQPVDPQGERRSFRVDLGEPTTSVIQRLHQEGLISDPQAFRDYLLYRGLDTSIQAGNYRLSPAMSAIEIAHALQDPTPGHVIFRILAGWRMEEVAAALPTSGLNISPDLFLSAAQKPPQSFAFASELPPQASLEGFLFPDTYTLTRTLTVEGFIGVVLRNFEAHLSPDIQQGFTRQGLNLYQGVTLASIVQREAVREDEMPLIASVFINRLQAGMKLDADPTVQYALGFNSAQNTWWTNPLSREHLSLDSPYNTYRYPGLPPGPISSPGLSALKAVAFPAQTPYFYFRAACDGSGRHIFAATLEEHVRNACP